ncbi:hypothetical protein BFP77_11720 [Maribacter sp. 4U21]|nr:hypothetical protein BFP77_11720 [Maribacter sp. 4U21]
MALFVSKSPNFHIDGRLQAYPRASLTDFLRFELFMPLFSNFISSSLCSAFSSGMKRSYWDFVISFNRTNLLSKMSILSFTWFSSLTNLFWSSKASWFLSSSVS